MWQSQLRGPARVLAVALLGTSLFSGIACAAPAKGPSSRAAQALAAREYTPDDATDKEKVQDWMVDADIDEEKLVFYTGPRGEEMAKNFVSANSDYRYYSTVFDETFISDFGDVNTANEDVALALSEALAEYASGECLDLKLA
jgi:hypothetical protein